MTRKLLPTLALIGLLALAPLALAQGEEKPADEPADDNPAWVEDCPPDMMCASGGEENATSGDCGGEACAYDGEPIPMGPEGCIECSGPPLEDPGTCMDGADANETCDPDVQYLDGRGPADCENCRGEDADPVSAPAPEAASDDAQKQAVPGLATLGILGAFVAAVAILGRRL